MSAAFRKVKDYIFWTRKYILFLDDIFFVSRGTKEDHLKLLYKILSELDEDNLQTNLTMCHFAQTEIECLGSKFNQSENAPLESKTSAILNLPALKRLKQLRSFLGSVNFLGKLIHNLY